jgi:hypothetical protein
MNRLVRESVGIKLHPDNVNREEGQSWTGDRTVWFTLSNTVKGYSRMGDRTVWLRPPMHDTPIGRGIDLTDWYRYQRSFIISTLKMETVEISETLVFSSILTWLIAWTVALEIIRDWTRASTLRRQHLNARTVTRPAEISSVLHSVWWCGCLLLWSGLPCQCETRTKRTSNSLL